MTNMNDMLSGWKDKRRTANKPKQVKVKVDVPAPEDLEQRPEPLPKQEPPQKKRPSWKGMPDAKPDEWLDNQTAVMARQLARVKFGWPT